MKKTRIILGVLAICLLCGGLVWAGGGGSVANISWWQVNGGGESAVSGSTTLHSTIGQWIGSGSASTCSCSDHFTLHILFTSIIGPPG